VLEEFDMRLKATMHLLVYIFTGVLCVAFGWVGYMVHESEPGLSTVLTSVAIALGPTTLLGVIYQYFLFGEIRQGAKQAFNEEMVDRLDQLDKIVDHNRRLHDLGVVRVYGERKEAFRDLEDWLAGEQHELFFVGTSLLGIVGRDEGSDRIRDIIREKAKSRAVRLRFLLTHPVYAALRQGYEAVNRRSENSVAKEVLDTVHILQDLAVSRQSIKFFLGTPTCFGIKTSRLMLLNPYPYQQQALKTFCLVVSKDVGQGKIYRAFDENHFKGVWNSASVEELSGFGEAELAEVFRADPGEVIVSHTRVNGLPDRLSRGSGT